MCSLFGRRKTSGPLTAGGPVHAACGSTLFILLWCVATMPSAYTAAESVSVSASLDKKEIHIGERAKLVIKVDAPAGTIVTMPSIGESLGGMHVCSKGEEVPRTIENGKVVHEAWCLLTAYELKSYKIPSMTVKYHTAGGEEGASDTPELEVVVASVIDKAMKDIRDIQGPLAIPAHHKKYYLILGALLGIVLLLVVLLLRRRRRGEEAAPLLRPAHEIALEELQKLKDSGLIAAGKIQEFYIRLTDIARRYIEARFGMAAPERTTEEFLLMMLTAHEMAEPHKELIADFLQHCDLVKFARYGPTAGETNGAIDSVERLVTETKVISRAVD